MSINGLQQLVRASVAKAKEASLRAESGAGGPLRGAPGAGRTGEPGAPVRAAASIQLNIAAGGSAASEQLRADVAVRGGVQATVVAALGGTRYVVDVGGKQTAVVLEGAAIADGRALEPGAEVRLVELAGRGTAQQARAAPPGVDTSLSGLGRLIADAARPDEPGAPARGALDPARLPMPPSPQAMRMDVTQPMQVARVLQDSVESSGLFYESHLAEWIEGRRSLESVQREAIARASFGSDDGAAPGGGAPAAAAPREIGALVREQLQALQAQQLIWQRELWPGQRADIELGRDPRSAVDEAAQTWHARVALELPALGRVEVKVALTGSDLVLHVAAAEPARDPLLAGVGLLDTRLAAQGLRPRTAFADALAAALDPRAERR